MEQLQLLIEAQAMVFNAAAGKTCGVNGCPNTPTSLVNDLCRQHENDMVTAAETWELEKLQKKYPRQPLKRSYAGPCKHDGQPHATELCPCKEI